MVMNTHDFEDLGDELFQMLCQALVLREFPNVQCYPVGMPDGGRDAMSHDTGTRGAVVFQVKFAREPTKIDDNFAWAKKAVDGEREKVERLAVRGAQQYILITNVQGTAHLDVGQVDKVQNHLNETLPIPAMCWWRGDLDRRLENAFDLKLRYPGVLKGTDLIRLLWELSAQGDAPRRRKSALQAYEAYHYREDSQVRFKQIELVSKSLLDLYVDVPATIGRTSRKDLGRSRRLFRQAARRSLERRSPGSAGYAGRNYAISADGRIFTRGRAGHTEVAIGGAELLTDTEFISEFPLIVVEGAPGQGKSTLTQYLAQLQRARILERSSDVTRFPPNHRKSPMAIPFRIELRDLASWLKGIDPWDPDNQGIPHGKPRSLEGALAAHVERYSGGFVFDVADLNAMMQSTPTLLLLDALDEVPDTDDRAAVVNAVLDTLARLEGNLVTPQVVITSRPTAIAGSPTFPSDVFLHTTLAPLEAELALAYAEKWARARRLEEADRKQLPRTLLQKIQAPHIAQLAKNTMQLSILLSLVQRRGASLPDKRTELYNAYFDIFLDRESEKSPVVRDNRDLLFDTHRFLGFHLHASAEQQKSSGRIRHDRLKWLLRDYLTREDQPYILVQALLTGMVERFGALVSRVEGQYEFEVQPLQEYFAARHLNDTAPPSPPGRERPGTKADRFDGIAANPYWFNVTRFLAGSFNKGELADLAERVCDLVQDSNQLHRPFSRSLCVALLQDWVFSQSPKATRKVAKTVFDDIGLDWAVTGYLDSTRAHGNEILALPPGGGAEALADICWQKLQSATMTERTQMLCRLLRGNSSPQQIAERWYAEYRSLDKSQKFTWLTIGAHLGVAGQLDDSQCRAVTENEPLRPILPSLFLMSVKGFDDVPGLDPVDAFRDWLDNPPLFTRPLPVPSLTSLTYFVAWLASPHTWLESLTRYSYSHQYDLVEKGIDKLCRPTRTLELEPLKRIGRQGLEWFGRDLSQVGNIGIWINACQTLEADFGRTLTSIELGVMAGGIKDAASRGKGASNLLDRDTALPNRMRYARRPSCNAEWWLEQCPSGQDPYDAATWCMAAAAWTKTETLLEISPQFDTLFTGLPENMQEAVLRAADRAIQYAFSQSRTQQPHGVDYGLSPQTLTLLSYRYMGGGGIVEHLLGRVNSPIVADTCLAFLVSPRAEELPAEDWMNAVQAAHEAGGTLYYLPDNLGSAARRHKISELVACDPWNVPVQLVSNATNTILRAKVATMPALEIAARDNWFENDGFENGY